jgi:hypothetical protein
MTQHITYQCNVCKRSAPGDLTIRNHALFSYMVSLKGEIRVHRNVDYYDNHICERCIITFHDTWVNEGVRP